MLRWMVEYSVTVCTGTDPEQHDERQKVSQYIRKNAICGKFQMFYQVLYLTHVLQPFTGTTVT